MASDSHGRDVQHNPDKFFNSTGKPLFNKVMFNAGNQIKFDNIGPEDLEATDRTQEPYSAETLQKTVPAIAEQLKKKFKGHFVNKPNPFPEEDIKKLKKEIVADRGRNLMEGAEDDDVLKQTFPIPKQHNERNRMMEDNEQRKERRTDLRSIAGFIFGRKLFKDLLMILFTLFGIGRGGEVKFRSCCSRFMGMKFCVLFVQWFQRKILKTNPSGFVPNYECPEICIIFFLLGCFWACQQGLIRSDGVAGPHSSLSRKSRFVFQDLHRMQDRSVTKAVSNSIKLAGADQLKNFYSAKSLRFGAMSDLTWDPSVTYKKEVALGGSMRNSKQPRLDNRVRADTLGAMLLLHPSTEKVNGKLTRKYRDWNISIGIKLDAFKGAFVRTVKANLSQKGISVSIDGPISEGLNESETIDAMESALTRLQGKSRHVGYNMWLVTVCRYYVAFHSSYHGGFTKSAADELAKVVQSSHDLWESRAIRDQHR